MTDFNYERAYNNITRIVYSRFPECELSVVDMVRFICLENDTLRMTLGMPLPAKVLDATETD